MVAIAPSNVTVQNQTKSMFVQFVHPFSTIPYNLRTTMSKMFPPNSSHPMDYDSYLNVVWNLHTTFLHDVLDAPNTTPKQRESALELLNMIEYFRREKYGITKRTSDPSEPLA
jgi:hypothetical protein